MQHTADAADHHNGRGAVALGPAVVEAVTPQIDGGRHPVKRVVGDVVTVEADIFREGHDLLAARLYFREIGAARWEHTPMLPIENDRWGASFRVLRPVPYEYTIEAWPDAFGTWQHDVEKKLGAGQTISLEITEGRALLDSALKHNGAHAGPASQWIAGAIARIDAAAPEARAALMLDPELGTAVARIGDPKLTTRYEPPLRIDVDRPAAAFSAWYELFPRSAGTVPGVHGTFADVAKRLPA